MTEFSPDPDNSDNPDGSTPSYHMSPDEFRRHGHALIDWLAHYMETVGERQVMPDVEPGEIAASIPATAPEKPEGAEWASPPVVVDRTIYRNDGLGNRAQGYQQVFVIPADGGSPVHRAVTASDNQGVACAQILAPVGLFKVAATGIVDAGRCQMPR